MINLCCNLFEFMIINIAVCTLNYIIRVKGAPNCNNYHVLSLNLVLLRLIQV